MKNHSSIKPTVAVLVAGAALLTSCASNEPTMSRPAVQDSQVTVGAYGTDPQQLVLAEVYAGSFQRSGREGVTLTGLASGERISAVRSGEATMAFGCTGELLGLLDPARARELAEEYARDDDPDKELSPEWRDTTYAAFSESLPGSMMATDPSNAQGCDNVNKANPGASLPQHVVPFYSVPALTRRDRVDALNRVAGSLTTKEVAQMTKDVVNGGEPAAIAEEWLATSKFATG